MKPAVSAKEKPSAGRREPATRPDDLSAGRKPPGQAQTQLRVRYFRRMNVRRVYPLTVEVPALRAGQTPPPVVESVVVRPVIPGAMVVPVEQKLDPNRPGATAKFHVTPLALGWLPDSRVEIHHPGRPMQEIPLGSRPMSMVLWVILLILFFPIVLPLRLLLGPMGGPPRSVSQWPTAIMLLLAFLVPTLMLVATRYAPMTGSIVLTVTDPEGAPGKLLPRPAVPGGGGGPAGPRAPMDGGVAPGNGVLDDDKKDEKKEEPKDEKKDEKKPDEEKKPEDEPKKEGEKPPMGGGLRPGGDAGMPGGPALPSDGGSTRQVLKDYSDQPGIILTDRLNTLFREQFPKGPMLSDTVYPTAAEWLGTVYAFLCDRTNQREFNPSFWVFVILLLFTGLSWVTHSGYRAATRKGVDLTPRATDAEAIETLPLGPNDRPQ